MIDWIIQKIRPKRSNFEKKVLCLFDYMRRPEAYLHEFVGILVFSDGQQLRGRVKSFLRTETVRGPQIKFKFVFSIPERSPEGDK